MVSGRSLLLLATCVPLVRSNCFGIDTSSCPYDATAEEAGIPNATLSFYTHTTYVDCSASSETILYDTGAGTLSDCLAKCETTAGCCGLNYVFYDQATTYGRCVAKNDCTCGTPSNDYLTSRAGMVFYKRSSAVVLPPPPPASPGSAPPPPWTDGIDDAMDAINDGLAKAAGLATGVLIAIIAGGVGGVLFIIFLSWLCCCRGGGCCKGGLCCTESVPKQPPIGVAMTNTYDPRGGSAA